jgi:hypothetical protein
LFLFHLPHWCPRTIPAHVLFCVTSALWPWMSHAFISFQFPHSFPMAGQFVPIHHSHRILMWTYKVQAFILYSLLLVTRSMPREGRWSF